jgi:TIR domain-containing protein
MYQIGILGKPRYEEEITAELYVRAAELGIAPADIILIDEKNIRSRDRKRPFIGLFFGYRSVADADHPILADLVADSVVIIPLIEDLRSASDLIPPLIAHVNCLESSSRDLNTSRIVSLIFENFRLLRSERRLFISYKRSEAQGVAIQLYERLDALGFDVFLDTHGVPPAVDFQSILWHRLADSDVVVLLDTPDFRKSRWTVAELARANATSIQILHFLWPTIAADPYSAFSQFVQLGAPDFLNGVTTGSDGLLSNALIAQVGPMIESLRSRAMAARHRYLVDNFCDQARALAQQASVQSSRYISLELTNARQIAVVPAIGIPNAARYQEIESAITKSPSKFDKIWLLYDDRGILQGWIDHVDWLNKHLPVTAVRVASCGDHIRAEAK